MIPTHILFVGATGSIGRYAVEEGRRQGYRVRALVRDASRARFAPGVEVVEGDLTSVDSMRAALDGIDGIVFTQGAHGGPTMVEDVDYGAVRNALDALEGRPVRIALMTAIGVTYMEGSFNASTQVHDWKRRSERLVRASGNEYTIVRPGWFDMNAPDQHELVFEQGDRHRSASPADGVVSRAQIAQVLVAALGCEAAARKTLELVSTTGPAQDIPQLDTMFAALQPDPKDGIDGVHDEDNFPPACQPKRVKEDLARITDFAAGRTA